LGTTGFEVELAKAVPSLGAVELLVARKGGAPHRMRLLADYPELSQREGDDDVFGFYWIDPAKLSADEAAPARLATLLARARLPRLDILQGADRQLYYRAWNPLAVTTMGLLPANGAEVTLFDGTEYATTMSVTDFVYAAEPGMEVKAQPFDKKLSPAQRQPRVQLRLSVDDRSEEFWLAPLATDETDAAKIPPGLRRIVEGVGRSVAVTMPRDQIDLGFQVHLNKFVCKYDPGMTTVAEYSSLVDILERKRDTPLEKDALITLNHPLSVLDPDSGRTYQLYQSSYGGPFYPGQEEFDATVRGTRMSDRLFISYLSANYDPGRVLKYLGSVLICVGMVLTFATHARRGRGRRP
jgi:hypothetical protein